MGSFNLLFANVRCSNCQNTYVGNIQFKYGDTWQLEYKIGDKVKWGGNDIGRPNITKAIVYGILENDLCPICQKINHNNEFDIFLEKDFIVKISDLNDINDYFITEGNYKIIVE